MRNANFLNTMIKAAIALILSAPLYAVKTSAEASTETQWSELRTGYAATVDVHRNAGVKP